MAPTAVAIAPSSGDVIIAGGFTGTVNFGGGLKASHDQDAAAPGLDTFVAAFDSDGAYKWAKTFGNGGLVSASSLAVSVSGSILLGGVFQGSITFGGRTLTAVGNTDIFVAEFDANGMYGWSNSFGESGEYQQLDSIAVDRSGNVAIAGYADSVSFGGEALTGYFIAKFNSDGAYSWSNAFNATSTEGLPVMTIDPSGNLILAGSFATTVKFGGKTLTSAGATDAFVAKFSSDGSYQWAYQYGDANEQDIRGVAADECGDIFVTGNFSGDIAFGTAALTAAPSGGSTFLAKIDPAGTGLWADGFSGSVFLNAGSVAVDGAGGPTIRANLSGSVDFGGGSLASTGDGSLAVGSFDVSGVYRWAYIAGSTSTAGESSAQGVAASANRVVLLGGFGTCAGTPCSTSPPGTTLVLDDDTLTAASQMDVFVAKFTP